MKDLLILSIICSLILSSCNKGNNGDYDDYETRIEYFKNIRDVEELTDSVLTVASWNIQLGFNRNLSPWSESIGGSTTHIDSLVDVLNFVNPMDIIQMEPIQREHNGETQFSQNIQW